MPETNQTTTADATATPAVGTPLTATGDPQPFDFEAWLKAQPEPVQAGLTGHIKGLKTALDSERASREAAEKEARAKAKAEEAAARKQLEDQGKFKELADTAQAQVAQLTAKVAELEPLAVQVERYKTALLAQVKVARDGIPAHVGELLDRMDPVEQLEYLSKHAKELRPAQTGGPTNSPLRGSAPGLSDAEVASKVVRTRL